MSTFQISGRSLGVSVLLESRQGSGDTSMIRPNLDRASDCCSRTDDRNGAAAGARATRGRACLALHPGNSFSILVRMVLVETGNQRLALPVHFESWPMKARVNEEADPKHRSGRRLDSPPRRSLERREVRGKRVVEKNGVI